MPEINETPWLEYSGQDTAAILACKATHRNDLLLCALEQAIQLRQERQPGLPTTPEEHTFLAIVALEREVNNGGYAQFFVNSSGAYAPVIVDALHAVGCDELAVLTARAIEARQLEEPACNEALNALDQEFYSIAGIETRLFAFVESHRAAFVVPPM